MLLKVMCIYDTATEAYAPPFFCKAVGEGLRIFTTLACDRDTNIGRHPKDFTLFLLGEFDDNAAKFELESTPVALATALEVSCREGAGEPPLLAEMKR